MSPIHDVARAFDGPPTALRQHVIDSPTAAKSLDTRLKRIRVTRHRKGWSIKPVVKR